MDVHAQLAAIPAMCQGRSPWAYGILLAIIAWCTLPPAFSDTVWSPVAWLNVAIHESGHFVTQPWAPAWISIPAGTAFQLAAPLLCGWLLLRQGEPFGLPVGIAWCGLSLRQCGPYIADASAQALPLLQVGNYKPDTHDWNWMLGGLGLLGLDGFLGGCATVMGALLVIAGLVIGALLVRAMARAPQR